MNKISRRTLLKAAGLASTGAILAACQPALSTTTTAATTAATQSSGESATKAPQPTQVPPKKEVVKITLVESWFGIPQYKESLEPINKAISEKMQSEGLAIEIQSMILDDHTNKYPLLYSSGDGFTMAFDAPWNKMTTLRSQGALLALEDLIEKLGPQLKEEITEKIYNANLVDGHIWGIPAAYYYSGTTGVVFREDLRKKYNAEMPTSEGGWRSLESFLQAIKENVPEMLPFANQTNWSMAGVHSGRTAWGANGPIKTGVIIPDITKGFTFGDEEEQEPFLDAVKILREWWEKGYINKTDLPSSANSQNAQVDFIYPGKAAACIENEPEFKRIDQDKQLKTSIPDGELMGVDMTGMRAGKVKGIGQLKQWNFIVFNALAPKEQAEAGIQFFNWLSSSQDNMDLWLMGVDGVNYKKEDNLRFSEIAGVDQTRNYRRMWYVSGLSGRYQRQPVDLPKEAEEAVKFYATEENWIFSPYEQFEPDVKALEVEISKLNAVYDEAVHGLNTGQVVPEDGVAKMKEMLDAAGRQEFKQKLQAQLDAYIAAHK